MDKIRIASSFILEPFYKEETVIPLTVDGFAEGIKLDPLLFDIYFSLQLEQLKPWNDHHLYIPLLLEQWEKTEPTIYSLFQQRNRASALQPMKQMIKLFLAFLFWTNHKPVNGLITVQEDIRLLKVKPVNIEERISYILSAPNHHHAFTQLKQLFIELKKKYALIK